MRLVSFQLASLRIIPAVLFGVLWIQTNAFALNIEGLSGIEIDSRSQGYRYFGIGIRDAIDNHWTVLTRVTVAGLRYNFESQGETLAANVTSVTTMFGLQYHQGTATAGLNVGGDIRNTSRAQVGAPHEREGDTGLFLQAEFDYWFKGINDVSLIASYSGVDRFSWSRLRLKRQITNQDFSGPVSWFLGTEGIGSGNIDFKAYQAGAFLEFSYRPLNLSWALKGGLKKSTSDSTAAYGGVEFYIMY